MSKVLPHSSSGSAAFCSEYRVIAPYVAGAMYRGIASVSLITQMAKAGFLSFFGAAGLSLPEVEAAIIEIQQQLASSQVFGCNLLADFYQPEQEEALVSLYLRRGVTVIEASAYSQITPALLRYRLSGLEVSEGQIWRKNRIVAKVSRLETAQAFLSPPPFHLLRTLVDLGEVTAAQARCASQIPMADDITVEADSGGHTDQGALTVLLPAIQVLRDQIQNQFSFDQPVRVGCGGGLGTPMALAAAFQLGADYVVTGSVNQCTIEAGTSAAVKKKLVLMGLSDTTYAPAGDLFEIGAKVQVLKKGTLFAARANQLYYWYRAYPHLAALPSSIRKQLEQKFFQQSFQSVWAEVVSHQDASGRGTWIKQAEENEKIKMALLFRYYFYKTTVAALQGRPAVDYQIHTSAALGAFNLWAQGTDFEDWRQRHVDQVALRLMAEVAIWIEKNNKNLSYAS